MYKIVIDELRELRGYLQDPVISKLTKIAKYNRTSGFVYGFYLAMARTDGNKSITGNMIDLTYAYLNALYKEYVI